LRGCFYKREEGSLYEHAFYANLLPAALFFNFGEGVTFLFFTSPHIREKKIFECQIERGVQKRE
jgi:hypothetical protein